MHIAPLESHPLAHLGSGSLSKGYTYLEPYYYREEALINYVIIAISCLFNSFVIYWCGIKSENYTRSVLFLFYEERMLIILFKRIQNYSALIPISSIELSSTWYYVTTSKSNNMDFPRSLVVIIYYTIANSDFSIVFVVPSLKWFWS